MWETILGLLTGKTLIIAAIVAAVGFVLKEIDNDIIQKPVEGFGFKLGRIISVFMMSLPIVKNIWNKVIEPYVIDLLDNICTYFPRGLFKGMRSDNK